MSKLYVGFRSDGTVCVGVWPEDGHSHLLNPRHDLANHSPDGFEWGYGGSGPAQLALALCADHLGDDALALRVYQPFKEAVVAALDKDKWQLTASQIAAALLPIIAAMGD